MDWTDEAVRRLGALWGEGHSAAEVGRRMGNLSKNAVVGKVHRLQRDLPNGETLFPARPSPIRRRDAGPKAAKAAPVRVAPAPVPPNVMAAAPAIQSVVQPESEPAPTIFKPPRAQPCCWPIGEPGRRGFRFCDEAAVPGKPYCDAHAQLAYVKPRDRRGNAWDGERDDIRGAPLAGAVHG